MKQSIVGATWTLRHRETQRGTWRVTWRDTWRDDWRGVQSKACCLVLLDIRFRFSLDGFHHMCMTRAIILTHTFQHHVAKVWLKFQPNFNPPKGSTGHSFKQSSSEHKTIYIKFLWEHCSDNLLYCCFICALCHPSLYMYINRHIRTHERMQSQCIRVGPNHVRQTSPAT